MGAEEVILEQAREERRKQDARLESYKRLSGVVVAVMLSLGAVVVSAADQMSQSVAGVIALLAVAAVALCAVGAYNPAATWQENIDILEMAIEYVGGHKARSTAELDLALALDDQYTKNEEKLDRMRRWLKAQVAVAFVGAIYLFAVLYWGM